VNESGIIRENNQMEENKKLLIIAFRRIYHEAKGGDSCGKRPPVA
jgi:hypothetical protein